MSALWYGQIIAESDRTVVVESNHYFPPDSVRKEFLRESRHRSTCPWKGEAHYSHRIPSRQSPIGTSRWSSVVTTC